MIFFSVFQQFSMRNNELMLANPSEVLGYYILLRRGESPMLKINWRKPLADCNNETSQVPRALGTSSKQALINLAN